MTTLAKDTPRDLALGEFEDYPVIASDIIFEGAAVGDNGSGYARPLVSGDPFRGFATQQADNSAGSAGDVRVRTRTRGRVRLTVVGVLITSVGAAVYATDDNAFTLTKSGTCIGYVDQYMADESAIVSFSCQSGTVVQLTDSSGGTADTATWVVAEIEASFTQATLANNFATATAKLNELLAMPGH